MLFCVTHFQVLRSSIMDDESVRAVCDTMFEYRKEMASSGEMLARRNNQLHKWMWTHVNDEIMSVFRQHPRVVRQVNVLGVPLLDTSTRAGHPSWSSNSWSSSGNSYSIILCRIVGCCCIACAL